MNVVVLGAGALGSIVAAHLGAAGHDVAVIARGSRAAALRRDGFRIRGLADFETKCRIIDDPSDAPPADLLVVTTKTYDNATAIEHFPPERAKLAFSVANGVLKNAELTQKFGRERVLGCMANTSGELLDSGEVLFTRNVCLHLGPLDDALTERAGRIVEAMENSGIHARLEDNIETVEWSKFAGWTALMALSVATRRSTPQFLSERNCAGLVVAMVKEMGRLAHAVGIEIIDQSPMPVASIVTGTDSAARKIVIDLGIEWQGSAPTHRMSSLQDLERGKRLEVEETLGHAVRECEVRGIQAPCLRTFYELVSGIDALQLAASDEPADATAG